MIESLSLNELYFPDPIENNFEGIVAYGGDLSPERLILAYSSGIFPWYNPGDEIIWWAPEFRPIYIPGKVHLSKNLKKIICNNDFEVRTDTNFEFVINKCKTISRKGINETWISEETITSYKKLFEMGYVHTVEIYLENQMVGGLYGVSIGKAFYGESMFYTIKDTSKIALFSLSEILKEKDFYFIDAQISNPHAFRMGANEITNKTYQEINKKAILQQTELGPWISDSRKVADWLSCKK